MRTARPPVPIMTGGGGGDDDVGSGFHNEAEVIPAPHHDEDGIDCGWLFPQGVLSTVPPKGTLTSMEGAKLIPWMACPEVPVAVAGFCVLGV